MRVAMANWAVASLLVAAGCVNRAQLSSSTRAQVSPSSLLADGVSFADVSVSIASGIVGVPTDLTLLLQSSDPAASITQFTATDAAGWRHAQIRSSVPGTQTLTIVARSDAQEAVLDNQLVVTFLPIISQQSGVPSAGTSTAASVLSTLQANPNSLTADGVSTSTLTLTVLDSQGLQLPDASVVWSSNGNSATLTPGSTMTDSSGIATATLSATKAQTVMVTATSGTMNVSQSVVFVPGNISSTRSTFLANPNLLLADNSSTSTLTFTALDAQGNPLANQTVMLAVTGSNNTMAPMSGTTDSSGVFFATLKSDKAETKAVTATSGSVVLTQSVTFLAGSANSSMSTLTASPNMLTVSAGANTTTLTITLLDTQGNPSPGKNVTFSATGGNNSFAQATGVTDAAGQFSTTLSSTEAQDETVVVTYLGGSSSTDVSFVAGTPSSIYTTLMASPNSVTVDGATATTLDAVVMDMYGNPVSFQTVSLSSTGSNNTISPLSGQTDASGVFTATMTSTTAETKNITATAGSASAMATVVFTAGLASGTSTTFSANPSSVTADGTSTSTLTVTVLDAYNNPVAGESVSIASSGGNNIITPSSPTTNATGVFTATIASTTAEIKDVTATVGGTLAKTASVTFTAGLPSSIESTLVANPNNSITADGVATSALTVMLLDVHGNPVASQAVSLSSSGGNNFFGSASGTTDASGLYTTTLASTTGEAKTVTANFGSGTATTTVTFVAGAPAGATSTLSASPNTLTADGASTTQMTFTSRDAQGNPVANQSVALSASGGNNTFNPNTGVTNAAGVFTFTLASTLAQTETITATSGGASVSTNVTFNPGPVSGGTTTFVANPNVIAADGSSQSVLVVTALDVQGNAVPNQSVSMSVNGSSSSFGASSGTTDGNGVFTTTLSSTVVQTETTTATVNGSISLNANVTFVTPTVSVTFSSIASSPNTVLADGSTITTITVTVHNYSDQPVIGALVSLAATGGANSLNPASGATDSSGVFTATLASTQAALKVVTATVGGATLNTNVTFTSGAAVSTTTTLVASPNSVTADGASPSTLTVTVKDVHGNTVPGQLVSLAASGGNNTWSPATPAGTTNANGVFTATIVSTQEQTETVTATINGNFNETTTVNFVPGVVSGVTTTFVASPNTTTADGTSNITLIATARDAQGNPEPNQTVVLSATGSNNAFGPASGITNASGVFTATLTSTKAQNESITATMGTVAKTIPVVFIAGAPSGITSTLVLNPTSVTVNGNTTAVTVTVKDVQGNPVGNQRVSLAGSGVANSFSPQSGNTLVSGIFTATLSSTAAQNENITATVGSVVLAAPMTFVAGSPNNVNTTFTASPTTLVANGASTTALTVTVRDAQGNPVPSQGVTFSSSGTNNTFSATSGVTNGSGVLTVTMASTKAEVKTLTATVGGFTETASVTFTSGLPNAVMTTVVANPTSVTANGTSTSSLTATVEDVYGNPIANQNVTLSSTGANNTFAPVSGVTNANGIFTATLASTTAETKTVTATIGSLAPTATVAFTAGAPSGTTSSVSASPSIVTANNTNVTTVTVTVNDAFGNLVSGQVVSVSANGVNNTWSVVNGTSGTTNSSGVWSTTLASPSAQAETITASIGSTHVTTTVSFVAGPADGGVSSLSVSSTSLPDDGTSTTTLQVTADDANSNPISGQAVTFASSGTGYTFSATTCATNTSGICSVTLKSTVAQTVTVTATFAGITKTGLVTFTLGAPSSTGSTFGVSPLSLTVGGTSNLTVTVKDATGNVLSGQIVSFTGSGTNNTFTPSSGPTNSNGVLPATLSSPTAQVETLTATVGSTNLTASITFVAGAPVSANSTLIANPNTLTADGSSKSALTFTVRDAQGNPVPSQTVSLAASGGNNTFTPSAGTTNAGGVFTFTLASTRAQTETITATASSASANANVTFKAGAVSGTTTTLVANPNSVRADGSSQSTLVLTALDTFGNAVPNQSVSLTASGGNNTLTPATGATNGNGVFTATLSSSQAQTETVTATVNGSVTANASVVFTATAGVATHIALTRQPGNSMPATCKITPAPVVTFEDANNTAVATDTNTITIAIGTNPGSATLGGTVNVAAVNGAATFNGLTMSAVGTGYTLVASANGMTSVTSSTFNISGTCASSNTTTTTALNGNIAGLATGDFNCDGSQDVLIYNKGTPSQLVEFLYGDGTGHFPSNANQTLPKTVPNIQAADFNGDNCTDFAVVDPTNANTATSGTVYLNNGHGTFTANSVGLGANPTYLTLYDANMDGFMDLIAGTQSGSIVWDLGTGLGTFGNSNTLSITTHPLTAAYVGNFGQAGAFANLCVYDSNGTYELYDKATFSQFAASSPAMAQTRWGSYRVFVSPYNPGGGTGSVNVACYSSSTKSTNTYGTNNFINNGLGIAVGDINGDGLPEILMTSNTGISAATGVSNCIPLSGVQYSTGHPAIGVGATDFNNNGSVDMVTANSDNNSVTVILMP